MDTIYNSIIEALIFSSDDSLGSAEIINAIRGIDGEDIEITTKDIENVVDQLNIKYSEGNQSFKIVKVANGYLLRLRKNMQNMLVIYHRKKPGEG